MPVFNHVKTFTTEPHLSGVSTMEILKLGTSWKLYVGSEADGGMSVFTLGTGTATYQEQIGYAANRGTYGLGDIDFANIAGQQVLIPSGRWDDRMALHRLGSDGGFDGVVILGADPSLIGNVNTSLAVSVAGKTFLVSGQAGQTGFETFLIRDDLTLEPKKTWGDGPVAYAAGVESLAGATVAGRSYFFMASSGDNGVSCYWMGQWGNVKVRGSIGVAEGLPVNAPTSIETAMVDGKQFLILGSAGTDTLSVIRVNAWGGLFHVETYMDSLATRFGGVQAVETFQVGNRTFVLAGGADDGLSLFELQPGGSLFHIETIADQTNTTLMNVSAIAVKVVGTQIQAFVTGSDSGMTQFRIDLGPIVNAINGTDLANTLTGGNGNDLISGKDGDDVIFGGNGNDRILDGAGADTMTGGSGADIFVLSDDGRMETITDFVPGTDRIDLTDFPRLYGLGQVKMTQKLYGVMLEIGDDRLRLEGSGLLVEHLSADCFIFDF